MQEMKEMLRAILDSQQMLIAKVEGLDKRVGGLEERMDSLEARNGGLEQELSSFRVEVNDRFDKLEKKMDRRIMEEMYPLYKVQNIHAQKIEFLEEKVGI